MKVFVKLTKCRVEIRKNMFIFEFIMLIHKTHMKRKKITHIHLESYVPENGATKSKFSS